MIQGQAVVRPAVPAEDMTQAFAYHHLVPAEELKVAVSGRSGPRPALRVLSAAPVKIPADGTARLQISVPTSPYFDNVQVELSDPPKGITVQSVSPGREGTEIVLKSDAAKVKPGLKGNLIVNAFATRTQAPPGKAPMNPRRTLLDTLPAIPFEIIEP
jgi:hypothetical protein